MFSQMSKLVDERWSEARGLPARPAQRVSSGSAFGGRRSNGGSGLWKVRRIYSQFRFNRLVVQATSQCVLAKSCLGSAGKCMFFATHSLNRTTPPPQHSPLPTIRPETISAELCTPRRSPHVRPLRPTPLLPSSDMQSWCVLAGPSVRARYPDPRVRCAPSPARGRSASSSEWRLFRLKRTAIRKAPAIQSRPPSSSTVLPSCTRLA